VRQSPEPRDIIWDNLGTEIHFLRRGLLMLLALSILVFFTTPNVISGYFYVTCRKFSISLMRMWLICRAIPGHMHFLKRLVTLFKISDLH